MYVCVCVWVATEDYRGLKVMVMGYAYQGLQRGRPDWDLDPQSNGYSSSLRRDTATATDTPYRITVLPAIRQR